jgi:hypothetical protein
MCRRSSIKRLQLAINSVQSRRKPHRRRLHGWNGQRHQRRGEHAHAGEAAFYEIQEDVRGDGGRVEE